MYRVRRHVFLRVAKPLIAHESDARVLDIGSGTGFYVSCWQELGIRDITASDLTDVAVAGLSSAFPSVDCLQLDATADMPTTLEGQFDVVSAMDVLFHIVDDAAYERALRNLRRLVRPGGHVILSENFLRAREQRTEHQVSRTLDKIERLLLDARLAPVSRAPMFVLMNTPVDEPNGLQRRAWDLIAAGAGRGRSGSQILGALLYPVELALVSTVKEGPSTEVMVCRAAGSMSS